MHSGKSIEKGLKHDAFNFIDVNVVRFTKFGQELMNLYF